jgi:hypothetical protein
VSTRTPTPRIRPAPAASGQANSSSTSTRARRSLRVYAPQRYYHRPGGSGDTHGYGKLSRFLDEQVLSRFELVAAPSDGHRFAAGAAAGARVRVDVDELFA